MYIYILIHSVVNLILTHFHIEMRLHKKDLCKCIQFNFLSTSNKMNSSNNTLQEIKEIFSICCNEKGVVPIFRLNTMLSVMNCKLTQQQDLFSTLESIGIDPCKREYIQLEEFITISSIFLKERGEEYEIDNMFELFAGRNNDKISFLDLKTLAGQIDLDADDKILKEMIDAADFDKDGCLSRKEFANVVKKYWLEI